MTTLILFLRSLVFALIQALLTAVFGTLAFFTIPFSPVTRIQLISIPWSRSVLTALRFICGVKVQVLGRGKPSPLWGIRHARPALYLKKNFCISPSLAGALR